MPRTCSVCTHRHVALIDGALVKGVPYRRIAQEFSVSEDAARRHKKEHLPELIAKAHETKEVARADDLLGEVRDLHTRTLTILEAAEDAEELRTALVAIREARGNLELLAKVRQLIDTAPSMNIHLHPEWIQLRAVILTALDDHPLAREDVVAALRGAMNGTVLEGR